jgi:uncharacterized protein (DUF302 family)
LPAGADVYRRDLTDAEINLLDAGLFALETHASEIGALVRGFLERQASDHNDGGGCAMNPDGMIIVESRYDPTETASRLVAAVGERGMTVMARIDHAAAAALVGLDLRPTEVLIFGNPRGGTPLMQAAQTAGLDLPLKALVWRDADGRTWVGYNDPHWIAIRHGAGGDAPTGAMAAGLAAIAAAATGFGR